MISRSIFMLAVFGFSFLTTQTAPAQPNQKASSSAKQVTPKLRLIPEKPALANPLSSPTVLDGPSPSLLVAPFTKKQAAIRQKEWAKYTQRKSIITNSAGMTFYLIPPGEFHMGSPRVSLHDPPRNFCIKLK